MCALLISKALRLTRALCACRAALCKFLKILTLNNLLINSYCAIHLQKRASERGGELISALRPLSRSVEYHSVRDAWSLRRRIHGYLPSRITLPPSLSRYSLPAEDRRLSWPEWRRGPSNSGCDRASRVKPPARLHACGKTR